MGQKRETRIIHKALDGEASKTETRILKKKIESDPKVREEYQGLKAVAEISKQVEPPPTDPKFTEKVLKKIPRRG